MITCQVTTQKLNIHRVIINSMTIERTFIAIKPDGVQRGYVAEIIGRLKKKDLNWLD